MDKIILASNSPRRKELLSQIGVDFEVYSADIDETSDYSRAEDVVCDLSLKKALAVWKEKPLNIILAADTVVVIDGKILGKPVDKADALYMLKKLSGKTHQVYTGVTVVDKKGVTNTFYKCTEVMMYDNSDEELLEYIESGEPMDKAGAYGIQGLGAKFIRSINGDYNNVVGLPVSAVYRVLKNL